MRTGTSQGGILGGGIWNRDILERLGDSIRGVPRCNRDRIEHSRKKWKKKEKMKKPSISKLVYLFPFFPFSFFIFLSPKMAKQCQGITKEKTRCKNTTREGSYCFLHGNQGVSAPAIVNQASSSSSSSLSDQTDPSDYEDLVNQLKVSLSISTESDLSLLQSAYKPFHGLSLSFENLLGRVETNFFQLKKTETEKEKEKAEKEKFKEKLEKAEKAKEKAEFLNRLLNPRSSTIHISHSVIEEKFSKVNESRRDAIRKAFEEAKRYHVNGNKKKTGLAWTYSKSIIAGGTKKEPLELEGAILVNQTEIKEEEQERKEEEEEEEEERKQAEEYHQRYVMILLEKLNKALGEDAQYNMMDGRHQEGFFTYHFSVDIALTSKNEKTASMSNVAIMLELKSEISGGKTQVENQIKQRFATMLQNQNARQNFYCVSLTSRELVVYWLEFRIKEGEPFKGNLRKSEVIPYTDENGEMLSDFLARILCTPPTALGYLEKKFPSALRLVSQERNMDIEEISTLALGSRSQVFRGMMKVTTGGARVVIKSASAELIDSELKNLAELWKAIIPKDVILPHVLASFQLNLRDLNFQHAVVLYPVGASVWKLIGSDASTVVNALKGINEALKYVHSRGYLHRDVSPNNIVLVEGGKKAMLIDWELACEMDKNTFTEMVGTFAHCSMKLLEALVNKKPVEYLPSDDFESLFLSLLFVLLKSNADWEEANKDKEEKTVASSVEELLNLRKVTFLTDNGWQNHLDTLEARQKKLDKVRNVLNAMRDRLFPIDSQTRQRTWAREVYSLY